MVLTELARQVGLALHNVELDSALQKSLEELRLQAEQLQESRARIVAASDAARRQIERNLHDGAQQHLVALAVNVRLARRLAETDPAGVSGDPRPAGGGPAKRRPGTSCPGSRHLPAPAGGPGYRGGPASARPAAPRCLPRSRRPGLRRYSPEMEAAVYFCCLEALQNAGKHAGPGATRHGEGVGGAGALSASRWPTTGPASMPAAARARAPALSTWVTGWAPWAAACRSAPHHVRAPQFLGVYLYSFSGTSFAAGFSAQTLSKTSGPNRSLCT